MGVPVPQRLRWCSRGLWLAAGVFVAGWLAAITAPGVRYVWMINLMSDLGALHCGDRDARWVCSPRHNIFNASLMLSGVLTLAVAGWLRDLRPVFFRLTLVVLGVGLMTLGGVPVDLNRDLHLVGVVLSLPAAASGFLLSAARGPRPLTPERRITVVLAAVALVACSGDLLPKDRGYPVGLSEHAAALALLCILGVEAHRLSREEARLFSGSSVGR